MIFYKKKRKSFECAFCNFLINYTANSERSVLNHTYHSVYFPNEKTKWQTKKNITLPKRFVFFFSTDITFFPSVWVSLTINLTFWRSFIQTKKRTFPKNFKNNFELLQSLYVALFGFIRQKCFKLEFKKSHLWDYQVPTVIFVFKLVVFSVLIDNMTFSWMCR